jgi:hypothetical protein
MQKKINDFLINTAISKKRYSFAKSRSYKYDEFGNAKKTNFSGLPTGFYKGVFFEEVWIEERPIGSIKGFEDW